MASRKKIIQAFTLALGAVVLFLGVLLLSRPAPSPDGGMASRPAGEGRRQGAQPANAAPGKINILLVSLCSVRADHMSGYGYKRRTSPTFDRLARDGYLFENAVTQWPKTVPAFAALMTGKYGHTTGVMRMTPDLVLEDRHETLAEVLGRNGYRTGAFVTSGALSRETNLFQGFDKRVLWQKRKLPFTRTVQDAVDWIKAPDRRPYFAWVHFNNAHQPYEAPGAPKGHFMGDALYDRSLKVKIHKVKTLDLGIPLPADHPCPRQVLRADVGGAHPENLLKERPDELAYYLARYDAGIFGADVHLRALLESLKGTGVMSRTAVVVLSDHGESLGDHDYWFRHGRFAYDSCARVPLVIHPPGGVKRTVIKDPVPLFGVAPTLLEMAGIPAPKEMEAPSLLPAMQGKPAPKHVFLEAGYNWDYQLAVYEGNYKLIHLPDPVDRALARGVEYELYDLRKDPGETTNLADALPEVAARLKKALADWSAPWKAAAYKNLGPRQQVVAPETTERLKELGYIE